MLQTTENNRRTVSLRPITVMGLAMALGLRGCDLEGCLPTRPEPAQDLPSADVKPSFLQLESELARLENSREMGDLARIVSLARYDDEVVRQKARNTLSHVLHSDTSLLSDELVELAFAGLADLDRSAVGREIGRRFVKNQRAILDVIKEIPVAPLIDTLTSVELDVASQEALLRFAFHLSDRDTALFLAMASEEIFSIKQGLQSFSPKGAADCALLAGMLKDQGCWELLLQPLTTRVWDSEARPLRFACVWALGQIELEGDHMKERVKNTLCRSLHDPVVAVGCESARSIVRQFPDEATRILAHELADASAYRVNEVILDHLSNTNPQQISLLAGPLERFVARSEGTLDTKTDFRSQITANLRTAESLLNWKECAASLAAPSE